MKKTVFTGIATALITPLNENGIDYELFGRLVDWQIESGIDALVVCGTTGESSTLTDEEHRDAISFVVKKKERKHQVVVIYAKVIGSYLSMGKIQVKYSKPLVMDTQGARLKCYGKRKN